MKLVVVLLLVGIVSVSCLPQRGEGRGRRGKICQDNGGVDTCECKDGSTCSDMSDCKENCGRKNIVSCTCQDGEIVNKPEKPRRGPCKENGGVETCECNDGSTCDGYDDCKENCGKRKIVSCTCADGEEWTKPEKPSKPGKPCGSRKEIVNCTCKDGETYEKVRDIRKNCKRGDNPVQECECKNGDTWKPEDDSEEEE